MPSRRSKYPGVHAHCGLVVFLVVLLSAVAVGRAQPAIMPQPALLPHYSPLCDSNLIGCLNIDDFGAHAYAHLMVLPRTEARDTAAAIPYGLTLGLFGRFAGGISTHYSFWQQGGQTRGQHGPLRLDLTVLLWPLLPFGQAPQTIQEQDGPAHFQPARHLRVGLHYEHQLRVGPFDGANALGLLADLAVLRLVASRFFGPVELSASLGALYDWRGSFATSEAALQVGVYLPFFPALKVYGEALGRGWPAHIKKGEDGGTPVLPALLTPDGADPIHREGVLGLGLSFRPQARVDLGVSMQKGFGGLAPSTVLVRFAVLSAGKTYQRRVATPVAEIAAAGAVEIGARIRDFLDQLPIDPKLDKDCVILDHDGSVMGRFGERTPNATYCEENRFRVPVGLELNRPRKSKDRLCRDEALTDCLLELHAGRWLPVHRPRLNHRCEMYDSDGTFLGTLGKATPEGGCRYPVRKSHGGCNTETVYEERPVGERFYTDADRSRVCVDPGLQRCFMSAAEGRGTLAVEGRERDTVRFLEGGGDALNQRWQGAKHITEAAQDLATGKVKLTTVYEEGKQALGSAARKAADTLSDPVKLRGVFSDAVGRVSQAVEDFEHKSPEEKRDAAMRLAGGGAAEIGLGAVTGGLGRFAGSASGVVNTARRAEKTAETFAEVATAKGAKDLAKAGQRAAQQAEHLADLPKPRGGTYLLVDEETGRIVRTGRTNDFRRRELEHRMNPETKDYRLKPDKYIDGYPETRGREQIIHDKYSPPLNKIRPISPKNPRRDAYLEAAKRLDEEKK